MAYNLKRILAKEKREKWEQHTEMRLRENYDMYSKDISHTEEELLEKQRTGKDQTYTTEKQLEKSRTGERHAVVEKQLDTVQPSYGGVNRTESSKGDIPLLESKRLSSKPVMEKEKYTPANDKK